jgi:hypothetical protein
MFDTLERPGASHAAGPKRPVCCVYHTAARPPRVDIFRSLWIRLGARVRHYSPNCGQQRFAAGPQYQYGTPRSTVGADHFPTMRVILYDTEFCRMAADRRPSDRRMWKRRKSSKGQHAGD